MIKHFNTALGATSGSGSTKGKGGNALVWVLGLGVLLFVGYKFIENRNKIVTQEND